MVASTLRSTNSARTWASNTAPGSSLLIAASERYYQRTHRRFKKCCDAPLFRARQSRLLDDLAPARNLALDEELELRWRRACLREGAVLDQRLGDGGVAHDLADIGVELVDDRCRHVCRGGHGVPRGGVVAWNAHVGERRDVHQRRHPLLGGDAKRADLAALDQRERRRHVAEHHLDMAPHEIVERRSRALVRDMHQGEPEYALEHLGVEMVER